MAAAVEKKVFGSYVIHERQLIEYCKTALIVIKDYLSSGAVPVVVPTIETQLQEVLKSVDNDKFNLFRKMFGEFSVSVGNPTRKESFKKQAMNWNFGLPIYLNIANSGLFLYGNVHYSAIGCPHFSIFTNTDSKITANAIESHVYRELRRLDELQGKLLDAWENYDKYVKANKRIRKQIKAYEDMVNPYFKLNVSVWNSNSASSTDLYPLDV